MKPIQLIGGPLDGVCVSVEDPTLSQHDPNVAYVTVNTVLLDKEPKPTHCHACLYKLVNPTYGVWEYHFVSGSIQVVQCPEFGDQIGMV